MANNILWYLFFLIILPLSMVTAEENQSGQVFDLGQVLVKGVAEKSDKITTTETISIEDIQMQGATTVAEVLEFVPGVDIQIGKKGQSSVRLRGFKQSAVKILIDGVPAHESYFGSLDLGQISIDSVAQIKIIKGASSVLYGPNTMGGIINIITKKGGEKPFTSLTTSFGENHTQNYILNHGASFGKFNYWITGSQRKTDGFELSDRFNSDNKRTGLGTDFNEDGGNRDLSYYKKNTFSAKIGYEYDHNSQVSFSFDYHDNEKGCPTEDNRYWEFSKWNQWHINLVGEHDVTEILTLKARLYYVDHEDILEDISWDASHTTSKKWFEKSIWDDYTAGGEIHAYLDFGELSLVKMGVSYMKDNHVQYDVFDSTTKEVLRGRASVGSQPEEEYEIDVYSYGIEDEILLFDERLSVNAGVSFDVHKPVKASDGTRRDKTSSWNPQAGIAFNITNDLNIYTSIAKKTKFPQIGELYSNLAGGNSSLKSQKTIAYEIGVNKKFNNIFNFHTALFYNDIEDRIIRVSNQVTGDKEYVNKGESVIKGLETRLDITTPWNLDIGLGYTYITSKDRDDKDSVWTETNYIPEHKATLDARYAFDFGLSTSFQAVYTGNQVEYDRADNKIKIDDFIVCNLRLNQKLNFIPKITTNFFFEVSNVFDENYDEGNDPYPGRNFLAGITLKF